MDNNVRLGKPSDGSFSKVHKFDEVQPDGSLAKVTRFDFKGRETSSELYADYELQDLLQVTTRRYRPDGSCQMLIRYAYEQEGGVHSCAVYLRSNGVADIKKYYANEDFTDLLYTIKTHYAQDGSYAHTIIKDTPGEMSAVLKYRANNVLQYGKFYSDPSLQDLVCVQTRSELKDGHALLYVYSEPQFEGYQSKVDVFDKDGMMTGSTYYATRDFKELMFTCTYTPYPNGDVSMSWMYSSDQGGWFSKVEEYSEDGTVRMIRYFSDDKFEHLFRVEEFDEDGNVTSSQDY